VLYQAIIKHRHFDLVVQKAAELGAARVVPVRTARTVKEAHAGAGRWRAIAAEASRQCGRADVMAVDEVAALDAALAGCAAATRVIAWEGDGGSPLADALARHAGGSIALAVGPEGGFTDGELQAAVAAGFVPVTLGRRVLRAETAPLALLSVVQYVLGDLGGRTKI
jgi:16S rRNA (uracil1498-N3)-methyltransferase